MTLIIGICVAVTFGVSVYMLLGGELKTLAMGVFLLSHAANLSIIAMSGSPIVVDSGGEYQIKNPPVIPGADVGSDPLNAFVDPLPQALILTAIVIGFAVMGFLLSLIVVTGRSAQTLNIDKLAKEQLPTPSEAH